MFTLSGQVVDENGAGIHISTGRTKFSNAGRTHSALTTRTIGGGVVVNAPGWQELLETNKTEFIETFIARPQFSEAYPLSLTPAESVEPAQCKNGRSAFIKRCCNGSRRVSGSGHQRLGRGTRSGTAPRSRERDVLSTRTQPCLCVDAILWLLATEPKRGARHQPWRLQLLATQA